MDRVAVRTDRNDVRQLAAKGQVARNVDAFGGVITEIGGIVRECLDVRREILDGRKDVSLRQKGFCKGGEIKPFTLWPFSQKTEVEVSGVNVHICLHKDKVSDLANRDPVPLWLNLAAGCRYYRKISFGLQ